MTCIANFYATVEPAVAEKDKNTPVQ